MADEKQPQGLRAVWWEENAHGVAICIVDQSLLPQQVKYLRLEHEQQVAEAISTLKVRGAPAIGVTAAFGMALSLYRLLRERGSSLTPAEAQRHLRDTGELLRHTRPTAVNLSWAIERMQRCVNRAISEQCDLRDLTQLL